MEKVDIIFLGNNTTNSLRKIELPKVLLTFGFVVAFVLFLFSLQFTYSVAMYTVNRVQFLNEKLENSHLEGQLIFSEKMSRSFEAKIVEYFSFDDNVRILYGMQSVPSGVRDVGIGGPDLSYEKENLDIIFSDKKNNDIKDLKFRLEKLVRQTQLEYGNINEISKKVTENKKKFRHFPSIFPTNGRFTSSFGYRFHPIKRTQLFHEGIDIANKVWTPIYATADGIVTYQEYNSGYGNLMVLNHSYGYQTLYGHLESFTVKKNQFVLRGDLIGYMGNTGRSTGPHLHYEIRVNGKAIDPMECIFPLGHIVTQYEKPYVE